MSQTSQPAIHLEELSKRFQRVVAVDDISLDIAEGEFFSLLGPSGCGKTTTLRMMAGFEYPDSGSIHIRGSDVTWVQPNRRPVNMVFQAYELFPHMTVFENVAYGLKLKRVPKRDIESQVLRMLTIVGVEGLEGRGADQLSGGQQQRVALARALVNQPAVLLLDEPLSALDVKLRKRMQLELKSIQAELGTTFVYVTHDQEEALLMSDRIGIMHQGRLLQVASPREVYERPADAFVADFVGTLNDFTITVDRVDGGLAIMEVGEGETVRVGPVDAPQVGKKIRAAIRPERLVVGREQNGGGSTLRAVVRATIYVGAVTQYTLETAVGPLVAQRVSDHRSTDIDEGMSVYVTWPDEAAFVLPEGHEPDAIE